MLTGMEVIHVDEYIDELLRDERSCDVILPRIQVSPSPYLISREHCSDVCSMTSAYKGISIVTAR